MKYGILILSITLCFSASILYLFRNERVMHKYEYNKSKGIWKEYYVYFDDSWQNEVENTVRKYFNFDRSESLKIKNVGSSKNLEISYLTNPIVKSNIDEVPYLMIKIVEYKQPPIAHDYGYPGKIYAEVYIVTERTKEDFKARAFLFDENGDLAWKWERFSRKQSAGTPP